jgi:hypothetical protein
VVASITPSPNGDNQADQDPDSRDVVNTAIPQSRQRADQEDESTIRYRRTNRIVSSLFCARAVPLFSSLLLS